MKEELRELGFSENEIQVYLILLKTGPLTSYALAEKTSMNRGYLYELLKKLHEKGIISQTTKEGKKHYQAASPDQLKALVQFKLENLQKVLPQLKEIQNIWKEETKIDIFKGKYCYKTLLNDMIGTLQEKSEALILGIDEKMLMELEPTYLKRYLNIIKRKQIKEKVIVKKGTQGLQEAKTTSYRFLEEGYIGKIVQFIYENKIALLTLSEPLNLILIEDKDISDTYRKQFEAFWNLAKA